ncbi:hypothetical protein AXF42_Ash007390 [Apostasia shenzhenica]|uniref:Uncharacterized protein n=1 Tax=Apostasia shenzhenica TaxID=1088818 RepID=A0A2I0BA16_9ASPA|nr:hypothetical protein AXF42_Ash007390 [Apostasia shenzhenica]
MGFGLFMKYAVGSSLVLNGGPDRRAVPGGIRLSLTWWRNCSSRRIAGGIRCDTSSGCEIGTCRNCKDQFNPALNHPRACRFHTSHFGGETKRKFESVYSGGTMNTPDSGKVFQYWHCCGSDDPFDPGCTAAPHISYDE